MNQADNVLFVNKMFTIACSIAVVINRSLFIHTNTLNKIQFPYINFTT